MAHLPTTPYLFLQPYFTNNLWGKNHAWYADYNYKLLQKDVIFPIGEAWLISGMVHKSSYLDPDHHGCTQLIDLHHFYKTNKAFFGYYPKPDYPLLVKILAPSQDLSVQVHPDDAYALQFENSIGKAECWYFLKTSSDDYQIILNHHATNQKQFRTYIEQHNWSALLAYHKVWPHSFVNIPPKTIHALLKNNVVFELQQASDVTYRLYDYERIDPTTQQKRKLHTNHALALYDDQAQGTIVATNQLANGEQMLVQNAYFTLEKHHQTTIKHYFYPKAYWVQVFVANGKGSLDQHRLTTGTAFLVHHQIPFTIRGNVTLLISYVTNG